MNLMEIMTTASVYKDQRIGRLVVLGQVCIGPPVVLCLCDCGNYTEVVASSLLPNRQGYRTLSCGCLRAEGSKPIHGMCDSAEYQAWHSMKDRCLRPTHKQYHRYGGRGITVCDEWQSSFQSFYDHVGSRPGRGYSLDRIDNDKGYEPGNVRWATTRQQNRNTRGNTLLTIGNVTRCLVQWAELAGVPARLISHRLQRDWQVVDAVFAPPQPRYRHFYTAKAAMVAALEAL